MTGPPGSGVEEREDEGVKQVVDQGRMKDDEDQCDRGAAHEPVDEIHLALSGRGLGNDRLKSFFRYRYPACLADERRIHRYPLSGVRIGKRHICRPRGFASPEGSVKRALTVSE